MNAEESEDSKVRPDVRFYRSLKKSLDRTAAYTGWFYRANDSSIEINDGKSFLKISSSAVNANSNSSNWHIVEMAHKSDLIYLRDKVVCVAKAEGVGEGTGTGEVEVDSYSFMVPASMAIILHAIENNHQAVIYKSEYRSFNILISVPVEELLSFFYKLFANTSPWNSYLSSLPEDKKALASASIRSLEAIAANLEWLGISFIILDNDDDLHGAIFKAITS